MFNYNYPISSPYMPVQANSILNNSLIRVTGIDGAKAYQMAQNSTVALFDNNDDLMYIKTTDGAGFPTIRTFKFTEIHDSPQTEKVCDYVSKEEFDAFKKEVLNNGKQFVQKSKPKPDEQP